MTANEIVCSVVESERRRRGLSRSALARALGWGPDQVTRKLNGQLRWSMDDLDAVSQALNVPLVMLLAAPRELATTTRRYLGSALARWSDTDTYHALVSRISSMSRAVVRAS